jgi:hypothetical protein
LHFHVVVLQVLFPGQSLLLRQYPCFRFVGLHAADASATASAISNRLT